MYERYVEDFACRKKKCQIFLEYFVCLILCNTMSFRILYVEYANPKSFTAVREIRIALSSSTQNIYYLEIINCINDAEMLFINRESPFNFLFFVHRVS